MGCQPAFCRGLRPHTASAIMATLTAKGKIRHVEGQVDLPAEQAEDLSDFGVIAHEMAAQRAGDADEYHPDPGQACHHQPVQPLPDRGAVAQTQQRQHREKGSGPACQQHMVASHRRRA